MIQQLIELLTYIFQHHFGHLIIAICILLAAWALHKQLDHRLRYIETRLQNLQTNPYGLKISKLEGKEAKEASEGKKSSTKEKLHRLARHKEKPEGEGEDQ